MGAIAGSAAFLVLAPGLVAGFVPWWISHWRTEASFFGIQFFRVAGGMLIALGARACWIRSFDSRGMASAPRRRSFQRAIW